MKKFLLMTAAVAATSGLFAKKVKFQVDMTGKTISPNGVHVAGNFQKAAGASGDWKPSETALSNGGSGNIYSVVVDIPAKAVYEFKYINDNNWGPGEESIPAISKVESIANGGQNGNRWAYIDSSANDTTILPAILFGGEAPTGKIALRFAVDLQKEAAVSANGVYIAGDFQGSNGASGNWKPNETRMVNLVGSNKVYEYIAYVGNTDGVEFKYLNGNDWPFNESVPSACQKGGGNQNRFFQAASASTALAKVCFGSCTICASAPIPTYSLTFKVDMNSSDCDGGFDSVTVTGAGAKLTGFGAGFKMNQIGATGVYELTVANLDSGEVVFKYRFHKNGNTNWEDGSDRKEVLSATKTVDVTCFSSRVVGACPSKPASSKITFIVDFTSPNAPPPASKIYLIGSFTKPQWQDGAKEMTQVAGKPGVYSVTIDSICPGKISYKFTNGDPKNKANEENYPDTLCVEPNGVGGFNRSFARKVATPVTISYEWNSCKAGFMPTFSLVSPTNNARVEVERGNTSPVVITWNKYNTGNTYKWKATPKGGSLASALLTVPSDSNGLKTQLTLTSGAIDTILASASLKQGDSIELVWSVFAYSGATDSVKAEQTFTIKLLRKVTVGVSEITVNNFKLYPNPTNEFSILSFNDNAKMHNVNIIDIAGKVVRSYNNYESSTLKIERNELKAGIYFVNIVNSNNQTVTMKLMIQE